LPGRYAVLGPYDQNASTPNATYIGDRTDNDLSKTRRIELYPDADPNKADQVKILSNKDENDSTTNELDQIPGLNNKPPKPPVALIIDRTKDGSNRRLSVSEPPKGYTEALPSPQPFDRGDPALMNWGTTSNYKVVHLQRLANPLLPHQNDAAQPDYNPYLTIDSQPIDITAFNGKKRDYIGADKDPLVTTASPVMFASHQRGETNNVATDGVNNLWKQQLTDKPINATNPGQGTHVFNYELQCSLGFLNTICFGNPQSGPIATSNPFSTLGDPQQPFPWFTWNKRPYISELELLQVPAWCSSKLLANYSFNLNTAPKIFEPADPSTDIPFRHLMNFFESAQAGTPVPELHRVLEYVGVSSPFVGVEIQANPSNIGVWGDPGAHFFAPPFNRIPLYREPGKINLNTIYDEKVFAALMNNFCGSQAQTDQAWHDFIQSRRGYGTTSNILEFYSSTNPSDPTLPTQFARPFRSSGNAHLTTPVSDSSGNDLLAYNREINATLLRAGPVPPGGPGTVDSSDPFGIISVNRPLFQTFESNNPLASDNTERNSYFRYLGMERLANLTTTRSNVYAVWVTVGYFEVKPADKKPWMQRLVDDGIYTLPQIYNQVMPSIYPDGYELGQEVGNDTGEITRHRGFFIIDRSLPVGFQRGQDINVEKAILLKRFIE
jgi:hypothetical protein